MFKEDEVKEDFMEDTQKGKYLTFVIGKESYGIGIENVKEIIGILPITEMPELPDYIKGIINLRGEIIPVMDIRLRFKMEPKEYYERTCIIVVEISGSLVGMVVDTVAEVLNISEKDIVPPPSLKDSFTNRYIKGIGKMGDEVKLILDCDKLISNQDMMLIENLSTVGQT